MLNLILIISFLNFSRFESKIPAISSFISTTAILISMDQDIYREIKNFQRKNKLVDRMSPIITELGGNFVPISFLLFGAYGVLFNKEKEKKVCISGIKASLFTGSLVFIGKHFTGRPRPGVVDGKDRWLLFYQPLDFSRYRKGKMPYFDAFPSGHTALAFTWATVLSEYYGEKRFITPFLYSLATLAGLSRITEDEHWLSDVFVGAFIGYFSGKVFSKEKNNLNISFNFFEKSFVTTIKFNFNLL